MKKLNKLVYTLVTVISILLTVLVILFFNKPQQIDVKVGEASPMTIYAPRAIVNEKATIQAREEARNSVKNQYSSNPEITQEVSDSVTKLFKKATDLRKNLSPLEVVQSSNRLQESVDFELTSEDSYILLTAPEEQFKELKKITEIIEKEMENGVSSSKISESQENCNKEIDALNMEKEQKAVAKHITSLVLKDNLELDEKNTEELRNEAAETTKEIMYKKNETIITKGSIVDEFQYKALSQLGLIKGTNQMSATYTFGLILLTLVCFTIIFFFYTKQDRKVRSSIPIVTCCFLVVIVIIFYGSMIIPESMTAILPAGMFPGIVTIFSCAQAAILSNIALAVICSLAFNASWGYAICLIIAGTMSAYCFSSVKRRSHLLPASIVTSVFYGLAFCSLSLIESTSIVDALFSFIKGFAGGFISGFITIGSLPLVEWLFNATTPMKLSELANPENKLLKKLLVEAPGTYHHSLTVANISEIAARSIGADSLLTRVGAYYHDIGKLRHPLYFKENQYDKNAHDSLEPEESSQLIISHVTEGVEIAVKNRLPQSIIDIIAEHHGTTTTGYFLIRAREVDPDVDESKFTYPGPAPRTKEAAIVMLADSCEAAVRSIDDKTDGKIENMVRKIATERVNSGQFSRCNMTFEELETVIKVITKTLGGYFHERIKYE